SFAMGSPPAAASARRAGSLSAAPGRKPARRRRARAGRRSRASLKTARRGVEQDPASRGGGMREGKAEDGPGGEVCLGAEARAALGLGAHESVRVRERGARLLLLERRPEATGFGESGEPGERERRARGPEPSLPADRELTFAVDVRAFALPNVIGW